MGQALGSLKVSISADGLALLKTLDQLDPQVIKLTNHLEELGKTGQKNIDALNNATTQKLNRSLFDAELALKGVSVKSAEGIAALAKYNNINVSGATAKLSQLALMQDLIASKASQAASQSGGYAAAFDLQKKSIQGNSSAVSGLIGQLTPLTSGLVGVAGALKAIQSIDAYTKFNAQLKLATRSQAEFAIATNDVSNIANVAQASISSIGTLYARINNSVRDLGASQKETADITENVALALKTSGATAQEASSAIIQLSQAFGSGVLRGEEFNAVNEAAPALMRALAESMGVPVGALRELASNGVITSQVLLKAFGDDTLLAKFREQAKEVQTISGGWQVFTNQLTIAIGKINETTGASKILIGTLEKAATLLSVFEGGEKGSILRNALDAKSAEITERLKNRSTAQLKIDAKYLPEAKILLDARLKQAQTPNFSAITSPSTLAPNFSAGIVTQDINKIHGEQEAYAAKIRKASGARGESELDRIAEKLKALGMENLLLAQGVPLEDARTIAKLKGAGATDMQIVAMLNATAVQTQFEESEKAAEKTKQDLIKSTQQYTDALGKSLETSYAAAQSEQDRVDALQRQIDVFGLSEQAVSALEAAKLLDAAATYEQSIATGGMSLATEEQVKWAYAQIDAIKARAKAIEQFGVKTAELDGIKEAKKATEELAKSAADAFKKTEDEVKRTADSIYNSITDSLVRSFENGSGSFKSFLKGLQNTAKTAAIRLGIDFVMNASGLNGLISQVARIVAGASGTGSANAADGGGASGGGNSIFGQIKDIFTSGNNSIVGAIGGLGQTLSAFGSGGTGILRDIASSVGSFTQLNAGLISRAAPYAGAVLQLAQGNIAGAAFTATGAAIGSIIPGVGTAIGAALGSLVGSLFGGKKKIPRFSTERAGEYANGVFTGRSAGQQYKPLGAEKNIDGLSEQFSRTLGGFLKGFGLNDAISTTASLFKKRKASYANFAATFEGGSVSAGEKGKAKNVQQTFERLVETVLGTTLVQAIQQSKVADGIKLLFDKITDKTQVVNMINASVGLNDVQKELADKLGLTLDMAGRVAVASGEAGDALAGFVNQLSAVALSGRTIGAQLIKDRNTLSTNFNTVFGDIVTEAVLSTVSRQVPIAPTAARPNGLQGILGQPTARPNGLNALSGTGGFSVFGRLPAPNGLQGILGQFNAPAQLQQFQTVTEQVTTFVDRIVSRNLELPRTIAGYDELLKNIDKTSAAGQAMFADVFALRDEFVAGINAENGLRGNLRSGLASIVSDAEKQKMLDEDLATLFGDLKLAVPTSIQDLIKAGQDALSQLNLGTATEATYNLAAAFPDLISKFQAAKEGIEDVTKSLESLRDESGFKNGYDFNFYKGLANNYGSEFANQFTDGATPTYGASNNTGVAFNPVVTQRDNTTISTSDPAVTSLLTSLVAEIKTIKAELVTIKASSAETSRILTNVTEGGRAMQTEAYA